MIYDRAYYRRKYGEPCSRSLGILRYQDEAIAACYAFGANDYETAERWLGVEGCSLFFNQSNHVVDRTAMVPPGVRKAYDTIHFVRDSCSRQVSAIKANATRAPKVLDIGCGDGALALAMSSAGASVKAYDSSPSAIELFSDTAENLGVDTPLLDIGSIDWPKSARYLPAIDTIIFCASIEHIQVSDFRPMWSEIVNQFTGRVIIVNTMTYHPIKPNRSGGHVMKIDDGFYDRLQSSAHSVTFREGSHLVLEMKA